MNLLLIVLGIFISFIPPIDPDLGWHLKYAEYLVHHGKFLTQNIFSYTMSDYIWHNSYWLSGLILYLIHTYLGHILASLIFSLVLSIALLKFIKSKTNNTTTLIFTYTIVMLILSATFSTVRPLYFDTFFWLYFLEVVYYKNLGPHDKSQNKPKWINEKYFPIMFMLWANIHAEHLIGLFAYGVYFLFQAYDNFKKGKLLESKTTFLLLAASGFATFINPFGINLLLTLLKELTQPYTAHVSEWTSPIFTTPLALMPSIFVFPLAIRSLKDNNKFWYGALLIFFILFSIRAIYMSRILVILSIPAIIKFFDSYNQVITKFNKKIGEIILYSILPLYLLIFGQNIILASNTKYWSEHWGYPYDAVQVLKTHTRNSNIFNWYRWGGYLIWQLPEYPTFVDGRMSAWRTTTGYFVQDYTKIRTKPKENEELIKKYFDKYNIGLVLDEPKSPLIAYLKEKGWNTLFENDYSVLLERQKVFANR